MSALKQMAPGVTPEAAGDRIDTSLLQLVLERLWQAEAASGSPKLREETLRSLGSARGIVAAHVNEGMAKLARQERELAAALFQFLVTKSGSKVAHTAADLAGFVNKPVAAVESVLERLASPDVRILRTVAPPPGQPDKSYELHHDLLGEPVLAWRAEQVDAAHSRRTRRYAAAALAMVGVAVGCAALAAYAYIAERKARSQQLVARSTENLAVDPAASVRYALDALGARKSGDAETALRTAVSSSPLRMVMRGGGLLSVAYDPRSDRRFLALYRKTAVIAHADAAGGWKLTRMGYGPDLSSANLSPDGRRLVTTSWSDGTVRIWNAQTGAAIGTPLRQRAVTGARFSPDSRRIASIGDDWTIEIWTVGSSRPVILPKPPTNEALDKVLDDAVFDPSGRRLLVRGSSATAWLYDTRGGKPQLLRGDGRVETIAFSPHGDRIVTAGEDGVTRVWPLTPEGRALAPLVIHEGAGVSKAAFSPDGSLLATAAGKEAHVWSTRTGKQVAELRGHDSWVNDVEFRPKDGQLVVTASSDGTARVWDVRSQTTLLTLVGHKNVVWTAAFSRSGNFVLTDGADETARLWAVDTGLELRGHRGWVLDTTFTPDGREVLTAGQDRKIMRWNARTGSLLGELKPRQGGSVNSIRFSPDGTKLVTTSDDGTVWVRNASNEEVLAQPGYIAVSFTDAAFSPDGQRFVAALDSGWVGMFKVTGSKPFIRWLDPLNRDGPAHDGAATGVAWSHNRIVTTGADDIARVWDGTTGKLLGTYRGHSGAVWNPSFDPSDPYGRRVLTASDDRTARVWDVETLETLSVLPREGGHPQAIATAAFGPDGRVATGDSVGSTRIWDWRREKLLAVLPVHAELVNSIDFNADGRILSASDDGTARIYTCHTCVPLHELQQLAKGRLGVVEGKR